VKGYLAAVRNAQTSTSLSDPREQFALPLLRGVQAGISRIKQQVGSQPSQVCQPLTVHVLERIHHVWSRSLDPNRTVLWEIAAGAFFGFFQLGELLPESAAAWNAAANQI